MTSPFRDPPNHEGHVVDGLPSLRDVADEVQLKSEVGFNFITMPEGHLMSHMGPEYLGKRRDTIRQMVFHSGIIQLKPDFVREQMALKH